MPGTPPIVASRTPKALPVLLAAVAAAPPLPAAILAASTFSSLHLLTMLSRSSCSVPSYFWRSSLAAASFWSSASILLMASASSKARPVCVSILFWTPAILPSRFRS